MKMNLFAKFIENYSSQIESVRVAKSTIDKKLLYEECYQKKEQLFSNEIELPLLKQLLIDAAAILLILNNEKDLEEKIEEGLEYFLFNFCSEDMFLTYLKEGHKNASTSNEYVRWMSDIEAWIVENALTIKSFNIWRHTSSIKEINQALQESPHKENWKKVNQQRNNWFSAPWNKWVKFNELSKEKQFEYSSFYKEVFPEKKWNFNKYKSTEHFEDYIANLRLLINRLGIKKGDERVVYSVTRDRLTFTIGQRYCFTLYTKDTRGVLGVISNTPITSKVFDYEGKPKAYLNFFDKIEINDEFWPSIVSACETELSRTTKSGYSKHSDTDFENHLFQIKKSRTLNNIEIPKNQILYGPPGTGKTYNTINKSLNIIDPTFYLDNSNNRDALRSKFNELLIEDLNDTDGQIAFCTFHQSLSYEDFIEGIKPTNDANGDLSYSVQNGIFKSICELASAYQNEEINTTNSSSKNISSIDLAKHNCYKISLGQHRTTEGKQISEFCLKNNRIAIGYGGEHDYSSVSQEDLPKYIKTNNLSSNDESCIFNFKYKMKKGDYVFISLGNFKTQAIGRVVGDYFFDDESDCDYSHFREVEWLSLDEIPVLSFYAKNFTQGTIYNLKKGQFKKEFFEKNIQEESTRKEFVLIIDEINRGNVSSVFGELITLIEESKREGADEELKLILPYSKEEFVVPNNLHIIGTMNTADRSVEALDTALRRRFSFIEMLPNPSLIKEGKSKGKIAGFDLEKMLSVINQRIEVLVDRDHTIGHAFFMGIDSLEALQVVIADKIIPLLQEYFYGDYKKMEMVMGTGFFEKKAIDKIAFAVEEDVQFEGSSYTILDAKTMTDTEFKNAMELIKF